MENLTKLNGGKMENKPEKTKFCQLSDEIEKTSSMITGVYQVVSNLEEKLGMIFDICDEKSEEQTETLSIIDTNKHKVRKHNDDLVEIKRRLTNLSELF